MTAQLQAKPRYEILDGLRGVAAMVVLLYHHCEIYGGMSGNFIAHGHLAVDFFFILSGYVIGYAYDSRWGRGLSIWGFFKRRLIRLHPILVLGIALGVALFYFGAGDVCPLIAGTPAWKLLGVAVLMCFMVPIPSAWDVRGWGEFCPVNGNSWSLYWEYFANILYALVIRRFSAKVLGVFVAASAFLTLNLALNWDVFGTLGDRAKETFTLVGGWSPNVQHATIGLSRLLFPFFAGLLLSRLGAKIKMPRGAFWWSSLALTAVLVMPNFRGVANGIYEAVSVLVLFPLIVMMGAGGVVTGRSSGVCKWLGEISYPLYLIQQPIVFTLLWGWVAAHPEATLGQTLVINIGTFFLSIFASQAALRLYDTPLRKWLTAKWK